MVVIWVRMSVSWDDEEAFLAQVPEAFRPKVDVWNETFTMPFHVFRAEVRRIAERNHAAVRGAVCLDWEEIPDGALVLPVDDDDWFAPDIGETLLRHRDPDAAAYRWPSSFLEVPIGLGHELYVLRRRVFPGAPPRWSCTTNNRWQILRKLRRYRRAYRRWNAPELAWARPYVEMIGALTEHLEIRRR